MRVVPVWSNDTAASTVPYVGRKKVPLAAVYELSSTYDGSPSARPTGTSVTTAAARLKSRTERANMPVANTQGRVWMAEEMPATMADWFASMNDEPSHDTPRMEMRATRPPLMMLPLTAASGLALKAIVITPAAASMTIMISRPIST